MVKPCILLSNDDGIFARGLRTLHEVMQSVGEVWVVAPDRERSATGHALSLHKPLRVKQVAEREFSVDGTPTDCVYMALRQLLPRQPDIVVSGINHGANLGNDVLYSGTVSAAMEGALFGKPAIAVSQGISDVHGGRAHEPYEAKDFEVAARFTAELVRSVLVKPMAPGVVLNVNVPWGAKESVGWRLSRLGYTTWEDQVTARQDPRGKPYYWIGGERSGHDTIVDSDNHALRDGVVSVTPIHYDITDYRSFALCRGLEPANFARASDQLGQGPLPYPDHPRVRGLA